MAKVYKDSIKTVLISSIITIILGLIIFYFASLLLKPKFISEQPRKTYQAKITYPTENITLSYWRTVDGINVFEPILEEWKKIHPNVTIQISNFSFADYDKRLNDAAAAGTLPDLFMLQADWLPRYKQYLKASPDTIFNAEEYKKTFAPVVSQNLLRGNEVLGVSYGVPTLGLFYNGELFDRAGISEPPKTWQELVDTNSKLTKKQGENLFQSAIALGTANINNANGILPLLMMQNGAAMTNQPPTIATFDQPNNGGYASGSKALSFYTSFALPSKSTYTWSDALGDSTTAFMEGKTAMIIDYPYKYLIIKTHKPDLPFKMAKLPQISLDKPINYSEFWAEVVSSRTKYPEVAWDFYNFMTSYEIMNQYSIPTMKPASRLDLAKDQQQDRLIGVFAEQVASAQTYYKGNSKATDNAILEMINATLAGLDPTISTRAASGKVTESIKQFPY